MAASQAMIRLQGEPGGGPAKTPFRKSDMLQTSSLPTPEQIQRVLPFINDLEVQQEWRDAGRSSLFTTAEPEIVSQLRDELHNQGLVLSDFDWGNWRDGARIAHDLRAIASADLPLLCRMITAHVRADRFVGGHFLQVCRNGVMWAILRRIEQLVKDTPGPAIRH
jgi:hypothetical protein